MESQSVSQLIRSRRSVFPQMYTDQAISKEDIEEILENATWAPTHKKTQPWRFVVFRGHGLKELSDHLQDQYDLMEDPTQYSPIKRKKTGEKPLQSSCVIALILERNEASGVPEWEEIAAMGCAVQNMYLTCHSKGIGCYWSSPMFILSSNEFLDLEDNQRCLGLFYMGYKMDLDLQSTRTHFEEKTVWRE